MTQETTLVGAWIAHPYCDERHSSQTMDVEGLGGWRNRNDDHDHEHYEFVASHFGTNGAEPHIILIDETSEMPFGLPSDTRGMYTANISISTDTGTYASMDVSVRGSANVVSRIIEAAAAIFKEEAER